MLRDKMEPSLDLPDIVGKKSP
jgi:glycerol uptake facilitator-like aquaporin